MSKIDRKARWLLRRIFGVLAAAFLATVVVSCLAVVQTVDSDSLGSVAFGFLIGLFVLWPYTLLWVSVAFVIFGLPVLALFRWRRVTNWFAFTLAGMAVGAVSWILPLLLDHLSTRPPKPGLIEAILNSEATYLFTITGFFCGLIFWIVVYKRPESMFTRGVDTEH